MAISRVISSSSFLFLCGICVALSYGPAAADPPSYPLYCQGPLQTSNDTTPFIWAKSAAGAQGPGAGQCAWADRPARGSEFVNGPGNVICGALSQASNLPSNTFMEIGVYRDQAQNNCMRVTQIVGIVQPPFSDSPTLPIQTPTVSCGTDKSGSGTGQVNYVEVYASPYARWCADETIWSANAATVAPFFTYYDVVVATLSSQFKVNLPLPITLEITSATNGVFCACGVVGNVTGVKMGVTLFSGSFTNPKTHQVVPGFWGLIPPLHETFNFMTGEVSQGWPSDWWADHISAFPNAMDIAVLHYLGTISGNQNLLNASAAQQERFYDPSQPNYDPRVVMFGAFQTSYGFAGYAQMFALVREDQLNWAQVSQDPNYTGDNNFSALLSEYVIAYLSLGFGTTTDLTQTFVNAGVGTYNQNGVQPYTVSSTAVKAIGDAHCSIRAAAGVNVNVSSQLAALRAGNYASAVAVGGISATCPSECTFVQKWNVQKCTAKW